MPTPQGHQVIARHWRYACPPWRLFDALDGERGDWLTVRPDEALPEVIESARPDRVLLAPWVDRRISGLELLIQPHGPGSRLDVRAFARAPELVDEDRRQARHRLGVQFGSNLRDHVDG